jgi:hypothetical protein
MLCSASIRKRCTVGALAIVSIQINAPVSVLWLKLSVIQTLVECTFHTKQVRGGAAESTSSSAGSNDREEKFVNPKFGSPYVNAVSQSSALGDEVAQCFCQCCLPPIDASTSTVWWKLCLSDAVTHRASTSNVWPRYCMVRVMRESTVATAGSRWLTVILNSIGLA